MEEDLDITETLESLMVTGQTELAHQMAFGQASRQATALIRAVKDGSATPEQHALYDNLVERFNKQKNGTPDPSIPLDAHGNGKTYAAFNCFVRSVFYYEILAN